MKKGLGMLSTKDVVLNLVDVEDIEGTITQEPKEENILTLEFPVLGEILLLLVWRPVI